MAYVLTCTALKPSLIERERRFLEKRENRKKVEKEHKDLMNLIDEYCGRPQIIGEVYRKKPCGSCKKP